jgi:hypothetical protein
MPQFPHTRSSGSTEDPQFAQKRGGLASDFSDSAESVISDVLWDAPWSVNCCCRSLMVRFWPWRVRLPCQSSTTSMSNPTSDTAFRTKMTIKSSAETIAASPSVPADPITSSVSPKVSAKSSKIAAKRNRLAHPITIPSSARSWIRYRRRHAVIGFLIRPSATSEWVPSGHIGSGNTCLRKRQLY